MVVRYTYNNEFFLEFELYNTEAARKWLYVFNENRHSRELESFSVNIAKYSSGFKHDKSEIPIIVEEINNAIDQVNDSIEGAEFPFRASENMSWKDTQDIHRAFTTSEITGNTFIHNLTESQLRELKFTNSYNAMLLVPQLTKKSFDIIDNERFHKNAGIINTNIHRYEKFHKSGISDKLKKEYGQIDFVYNQWAYNNPENEAKGIISPDIRGITLTMEDIKECFLDENIFQENNVYMHSNIFGKPYHETFIEYDDALELDVRNVQNIIGELFFVSGPHNVRKRWFTNSEFTEWCEKAKLPKYITHPVPLGRIVGKTKINNQDNIFADKCTTGSKISCSVRYNIMEEIEHGEK